MSLDGAREESRATQLSQITRARWSDFRAAIESITGRRVIAFTSGMDTSADIATEVFVLETNEEGSEQ